MIKDIKNLGNKPRGKMKFMLLAVLLMIFVKLVVLKPWQTPEVIDAPQTLEQVAPEEMGSVPDLSTLGVPAQPAFIPNDDLLPLEIEGDIDVDLDDVPQPEPVAKESRLKVKPKPAAAPKRAKKPTKSISNKRPLVNGEKPKIVIIIDDVGVSVKNSRDIMALPAPLTLAFLPYARNLPSMTTQAREKGHELMIHVPMEAMNGDMDLGGVALKANMSSAAMNSELTDKVFTAFEGYKGINNHMGSRLTQDSAAMKLVMKHLKQRGLYFVDSRTINSSVAAHMAAEAGVKHATRDVFLDHYTDIESVTKALGSLERIAAKNGVAIGIGHPKPNTVAALKRWLPTLRAKGFELVPASQVVRRMSSTTVAAKTPITQIAPAAGIEVLNAPLQESGYAPFLSRPSPQYSTPHDFTPSALQ